MMIHMQFKFKLLKHNVLNTSLQSLTVKSGEVQEYHREQQLRASDFEVKLTLMARK